MYKKYEWYGTETYDLYNKDPISSNSPDATSIETARSKTPPEITSLNTIQNKEGASLLSHFFIILFLL